MLGTINNGRCDALDKYHILQVDGTIWSMVDAIGIARISSPKPVSRIMGHLQQQKTEKNRSNTTLEEKVGMSASGLCHCNLAPVERDRLQDVYLNFAPPVAMCRQRPRVGVALPSRSGQLACMCVQHVEAVQEESLTLRRTWHMSLNIDWQANPPHNNSLRFRV